MLSKANVGVGVQTEICKDSRAFALKPYDVQNLSFYRWERTPGGGRVEEMWGCNHFAQST